MSNKNERDAAADKYRDEDFARNPNGYTVAPYVNSETTSEAFCAGWDAALQSDAVRGLVTELQSIHDQCGYASPWQIRIAKALAAFNAAKGET